MIIMNFSNQIKVGFRLNLYTMFGLAIIKDESQNSAKAVHSKEFW